MSKPTVSSVAASVDQLSQAMAALIQLQTTQMAMAQNPQPTRTFGGNVLTPQQIAEMDAHNEKIRQEAERINNALRAKVVNDGLVDEAREQLERLGLDYEGIASFASNACYNARRSAYSIRAGVERAEEYQARVMKAPVNNPAIAQALAAQSEQQQADIMNRLDKAEAQKVVYFTYNELLLQMLEHHLVPIVDQNERQGMAAMESNSDHTYVSVATIEFLANTPEMSEADYEAWRSAEDSKREQRRKTETAATAHAIRANTATYSRRV